MPTEYFIKNEEHRNEIGVGIGDECFNVGIFVLAAGEHRNTPMTRFGSVAMIPTDRIGTEMYGDIEAYLTEARSLPAVSGSPVFVRESVRWPVLIPRKGQNEATVYPSSSGGFYLLGLNHGHFEADSNRWREINFGEGDVNIGLSVVVPASKILEVIGQPELAALRDEAISKKKDKKSRIKTRPD